MNHLVRDIDKIMQVNIPINNLESNKVVCRRCHRILEINKDDVLTYDREYFCQTGYAVFHCPCGGGGQLKLMYVKDTMDVNQ